eukprot:1148296-Pelagomonas_calceolata.AAC.2
MGMAERAMDRRRNGGGGGADRVVPPFTMGRLVVARQVQPAPPVITVASEGPIGVGKGSCQPGSPSPPYADAAGNAGLQNGVPGGVAAPEKTRSLSGSVEVDGELVGLKMNGNGGSVGGAFQGPGHAHLPRSRSTQHAQQADDAQCISGVAAQLQPSAQAPADGLSSGVQGGNEEREGGYRAEEDSRPLLQASSRGLPSDSVSHDNPGAAHGVYASKVDEGFGGRGACKYKQGEDGVWRPGSSLGKGGGMQDGVRVRGFRTGGRGDDGEAKDGEDSFNDGDSDGGKAARLARWVGLC